MKDISMAIEEKAVVAFIGPSGCGKTTLFNILTGQMDYDSGEVYVNPNKRLGLISQIPKFPAGYTVEDVLRTAFRQLERIKEQMQALEARMTDHTPQDVLQRYDELLNRYTAGGGYDTDTETDKICNGLGITAEQRPQLFDSLSGGEKIACRTLLIAAGLVPERGLLAELGMPSWLQMCGNCNTVYPMAEGVTADGRKAGIAAFQKIRG